MKQYADPDWLQEEIGELLNFYYPACVDTTHGGFIAQLDETTGEIYDETSKHLVSTCRLTLNFAHGARLGSRDWCYQQAERGVAFLHDEHYDAALEGYDWLLDGTNIINKARSCYGHAFVLLTFARATGIGVENAEDYLREVYDIIDDRFWEPGHRLCASEFAPDWSSASEYRGQNANMHMCEAMLAAYQETGEGRYLNRASKIAESITVRLAEETDGRLWEHYTCKWEHDFEYNRDKTTDTFRPYGYQPGHHLEWAKLLAELDRMANSAWFLSRAKELFQYAVESGWDTTYGGFYYTLDQSDTPLATDKYRWPVAEGIGAAAALYERTGQGRYRERYIDFWEYAEENLITNRRNWRLKLTRENEPYPPSDGPEVGVGYHPIGACLEGLQAFGTNRSNSEDDIY
ncbi:AGE family epimerase/isomerase [Haloarcula marina]|uniref:AGE family epimerase/isomerase n=1 Tax=Haloarcula marina TaxID=2961574 RepID=UPI0020B73BC8|nr:AGE family epimerase/isomerase [Halomicroarcula marina]